MHRHGSTFCKIWGGGGGGEAEADAISTYMKFFNILKYTYSPWICEKKWHFPREYIQTVKLRDCVLYHIHLHI